METFLIRALQLMMQELPHGLVCRFAKASGSVSERCPYIDKRPVRRTGNIGNAGLLHRYGDTLLDFQIESLCFFEIGVIRVRIALDIVLNMRYHKIKCKCGISLATPCDMPSFFRKPVSE